MRLVLPLIAVLAVFSAPLASAQTLGERIGEAKDIPVEDWRDMASGRTLTYRIDGEFFALERYAPRGDTVTLQLVDGTCLEGTWSYAEPVYCYDWRDNGQACFRHARLDGSILIIQVEDGNDTPLVQTMDAVSDVPLACSPMIGS